MDETGRGRGRRAVRRALLVDRESGLLHELPTVFVQRKFGKKSLNTQCRILYDLAFYLDWVRLKANRSKRWLGPEARVRVGKLALSEREVGDLSTWCQRPAKALSYARLKETDNLRVLPSAEELENGTTNARLDNIRQYLVWLTENFIEGTLQTQDEEIARSVQFKNSLTASFADELSGEKKPAPVRSLDKSSTAAVRAAQASPTFFPDTPAGRRDRLISRLFLDSGLRRGELLKLYTSDIDENYQIDALRTVAVVKVIRRPNDPNDDRLFEPAAKTLPGPVTINRKLARDLINYVIGDRRAAVERGGGKETPYLFVCHHGLRVGKPISISNSNRLIKRLNKAPNISAGISSHVLRHTHFTEIADIMDSAGKSRHEANEVLRTRGHWSPGSTMPSHYTQRFTKRREAELVDERDRVLGEGTE